MKRYDITGEVWEMEIEESPNGNWVKWEDVERLEESHKELLDALKGMIALGRQHGFLQTSADYPAIYQANVAISKAEGTK